MALSLAFVCAKADEDDEIHTTSTVMVRCAYCRRHAIGGYCCDTCYYVDVDGSERLTGHGPGKCVGAEASA